MIETVLIGLGRIAWSLEEDSFRYHPCTHAGTLLDSNKKRDSQKKQFNLIGICDLKYHKINSFKEWWGSTIKYSEKNYRELLHKAAADLVIIATSSESHHEIALAAIDNGARAILLEKPVALNAREAREIETKAATRHTQIWVNFERRYHPGYRQIKKYIEEEKFGAIRSIQGQVLTHALPKENENTGPLLHDSVHWIDLLLWYAGLPIDLKARIMPGVKSQYTEETAFLTFVYPQWNAVLESGGKRNYFEFSMQIDFVNGRIKCGNEGHFFFRPVASRRYDNFRELAPLQLALSDKNPWVELFREIQNELARSPISNNAEYTSSLKRISAGIAAARSGLEIIDRCYFDK